MRRLLIQKKGLLKFSLTARTKSKAWLKLKTSEWFLLSESIDLVKVMASTTSFKEDKMTQ